MRGSNYEILEWLTHHHEFAPLMQMSRQRLVGMRWKLQHGTISENRMDELLTRLQKRMEALQSIPNSTLNVEYKMVRKVRDKYTLPAIVRDHHGKFFNEITFLRMFETDEKLKDLNIGYVLGAVKRGKLPSKELVREALNRKKWNIFEERMEVPAVWEVTY